MNVRVGDLSQLITHMRYIKIYSFNSTNSRLKVPFFWQNLHHFFCRHSLTITILRQPFNTLSILCQYFSPFSPKSIPSSISFLKYHKWQACVAIKTKRTVRRQTIKQNFATINLGGQWSAGQVKDLHLNQQNFYTSTI